MKTHVSSNQQYQQLLDTVGSFGKYQIVLLLINFFAFFLSGVYETALYHFFGLGEPSFPGLDKAIAMNQYCRTKNPLYFPNGLPLTIPFRFGFECNHFELTLCKSLQNISIMLGLLISGYLSTKYGYKKILIGNSLSLFLGTCLLLIQSKASMYVSLVFINLPQYSLCCLFICLLVEVTREKYVPVLVISMFSAKLIGNLAVGFISKLTLNYLLLTEITLIPAAILFLICHFFYYQSLRYLIDHDIITGLAVLHNIAIANNTQHQQLQLGNQFVINKIKLNRYQYQVLFNFNSVRLASCGFMIVMFSLGFVSQSPLSIEEWRINRNNLSLFVSAASLLGTIPAYVYYSQARRIQVSRICCGLMIVLLIPISLLHIFSNIFEVTITLVLILALLLTTLMCFVGICLVQTYPHTVRNLAYCLFASFQYLGRLCGVLMVYCVESTVTQYAMYTQGLILILLYSLLVKETKDKVLQYQLKQLNEMEVKKEEQMFR